jgi:hypothetical protein
MGEPRFICGLKVDLEALGSISHRCEPALCRASGSCCARHDVWIGAEERSRIQNLLPAACEVTPRLSEEETLFKPLGPDVYAIRRTGDGLCIFAYADPERRVLCALHSAALKTGLAPREVKPRGCLLWPLALATSEPSLLFVQDGAFGFPCNRLRPPQPSLDAGIRAIVETLFGRQTAREINRCLHEADTETMGV